MTVTLDLSHRSSKEEAASPALSTIKTSLVGLTLDEMRAAVIALGVDPKKAKMRAQQVWRWLYFFGAQDFDMMTDIGKELRAQLQAEGWTVETTKAGTTLRK